MSLYFLEYVNTEDHVIITAEHRFVVLDTYRFKKKFLFALNIVFLL